MKGSTLIAFHGKQEVKTKYLSRVKAHEKADEIIKGTYWENGKGCAVGCTIEGSQHDRYESELGIPMSIAYLEDRLFEMMPNKDAKTFPRRFLSSIEVGADLTLIIPKFMVYILNGTLDNYEGFEDCKNAVKAVAKLWEDVINGKVVKEGQWSAARSAARSAAESAAWSAARSAAWSAVSAARSAVSAARSAAESAAWSAARSAAESAAESAVSAAWSAAANKYSLYLLKLLKESKPKN